MENKIHLIKDASAAMKISSTASAKTKLTWPIFVKDRGKLLTVMRHHVFVIAWLQCYECCDEASQFWGVYKGKDNAEARWRKATTRWRLEGILVVTRRINGQRRYSEFSEGGYGGQSMAHEETTKRRRKLSNLQLGQVHIFYMIH